MPTDRFFNLSDEKQSRIVAAVKQELERVPIDDMSINKIIQSAGIPRGSFYQYFEDKEDVVTFIMDDYIKDLYDNTRDAAHTGDLFALAYKAFEFTVNYGDKCDYVKNIFGCVRAGDSGMLQRMHKKEFEMFSRLGENLDFTRINITSPADVPLMLGILFSVLKADVAACYLHPEHKDVITANMQDKLNILKRGMYRNEDQHV